MFANKNTVCDNELKGLSLPSLLLLLFCTASEGGRYHYKLVGVFLCGMIHFFQHLAVLLGKNKNKVNFKT
jgi:hypothetical protein